MKSPNDKTISLIFVWGTPTNPHFLNLNATNFLFQKPSLFQFFIDLICTKKSNSSPLLTLARLCSYSN